jgi:hypothetical protein
MLSDQRTALCFPFLVSVNIALLVFCLAFSLPAHAGPKADTVRAFCESGVRGIGSENQFDITKRGYQAKYCEQISASYHVLTDATCRACKTGLKMPGLSWRVFREKFFPVCSREQEKVCNVRQRCFSFKAYWTTAGGCCIFAGKGKNQTITSNNMGDFWKIVDSEN